MVFSAVLTAAFFRVQSTDSLAFVPDGNMTYFSFQTERCQKQPSFSNESVYLLAVRSIVNE